MEWKQMEEIQEQDEATLLTKRNLDASPTSKEDEEKKVNKTQKLDTLTTANNANNHYHGSPNSKEQNPGAHKQDGKNFVEEEEEEEEDGDYEEGEEDEEVVVDRKGKGKGKGILMEEEPAEEDLDDDDEDDLSSGDDDGSDPGGDEGNSDLEDDPLAEVDLDNILPSRTRSHRAALRPGIHIANDINCSNDHLDA